MKYMPATSEAECQYVSEQLYHLTRPADHVTDTTKYLFGWQQDINGQWWMCWDEEMPLPIHAERSGEMADAIMQWVTAGKLTAQSAQSIAAMVQSNVGSTITLGQITPPEWLSLLVQDIELE